MGQQSPLLVQPVLTPGKKVAAYIIHPVQNAGPHVYELRKIDVWIFLQKREAFCGISLLWIICCYFCNSPVIAGHIFYRILQDAVL